MPDRRQTWETYTSSWKAESSEEKRALFEKVLAKDCVYTDPITQRRGYQELLEYMLEFHEQIPGGHFHTVEFFEHHGRSVRKPSITSSRASTRTSRFERCLASPA